MIEWLIREPGDRPLVKSEPAVLFDRFDVPVTARPTLLTGGRDDLYAMGVHPNLIFKWLLWSGRATMKPFPIGHFFDRR
jgi:2'-aminobiphenyl-2,3-diol 1,2-dioxygenase small subunit